MPIRCACLTSPGREDRFVGLTRSLHAARELEIDGRRYRRTQRLTRGGWPIFAEVAA